MTKRYFKYPQTKEFYILRTRYLGDHLSWASRPIDLFHTLEQVLKNHHRKRQKKRQKKHTSHHNIQCCKKFRRIRNFSVKLKTEATAVSQKIMAASKKIYWYHSNSTNEVLVVNVIERFSLSFYPEFVASSPKISCQFIFFA